MEQGAQGRLGLAAGVAAAAAATAVLLILAADAARSGAPGTQLLPDLKVQRPYELYVQRKGKKLKLRVSNTVANRGNGPLEIEGGGPADDCNLKNKPEGRLTLQNLYEDSSHPDSPGYFVRGHDPGPSQQLNAGCSRYHPKHDHWHFDNFARYTLIREKNGKVAGRSRKVSFCVLDTGQRYGHLPGAPSQPYYPQDPGAKFATCSATSIDGLSIGWEDTYGASLPGQGINVKGLKRGRYCLILEADPADSKNPGGQLEELREGNNVRDLRIALRPRREFVKRLSPVCKL